ncbi:P1 family peptidase [Fodinicola feengrottensis]|uniref:P1 family peptidase n=1 Tax=Fodinicola feengrottensis TaxID=435914 RepID=A0ABP4SWY1_9ACTN
MRVGPTNSLTDVAGLRVGHHERTGDGWLTGTTVVLAPPEGAVAGVDVRGGAPGTRDTDALDPRNVVERAHAVVLTGGSAYGLASACGVADALGDAGIGFPVGVGVVPIVPAAVIFDLGRGGDARQRPGPDFGLAAYQNVSADAVPMGCVGAGTGAVVGALKGGVGSASARLSSGATVAAMVVVNAVGSAVDARTGELYGARFGLDGEFALRKPDENDLAAARTRAELGAHGGSRKAPLATTIGVIGTDLTLTKAHCAKIAGIGHDGLARALRPVHTMVDGDTLFTLSTTALPAPDPERMYELMEAAGDCVTRAVVHAVLAATSVKTPAVDLRSYADAFPSAVC